MVEADKNHESPGAEHHDESAREILHELEKDGIKKPPVWRQLVPWAITAVILWWIFKDLNFAEFMEKLEGAKLAWLLPAMFGFTFVFAVGDLFSFGISYKWFVAPDLTPREIIHVRWGCYFFHVLNTPLIGVANIVYFMRHKGAPLTWTLSGNQFAALNDAFVANAVMTVALILNTIFGFAPELESFWLFPLAFPWLIAFVHFRYWFSDSKDRYLVRFSNHPLLRAARHGEVHHYVKIYAVRLTVSLTGIAAHYVALKSFGIDVPLPVVFMVAPLILGGAFMPISGGGFGGPQLVALILLPYFDGDKTLLAAYSMSFSACFMMGRALLGAIFFPGYLKDLKDSVPKMTVDPITGEPMPS